MAYIAKWSVFIDGDDLDFVEVARRAREHCNDTRNNTWLILNIADGHCEVVDLRHERIVAPLEVTGA